MQYVERVKHDPMRWMGRAVLGRLFRSVLPVLKGRLNKLPSNARQRTGGKGKLAPECSVCVLGGGCRELAIRPYPNALQPSTPFCSEAHPLLHASRYG